MQAIANTVKYTDLDTLGEDGTVGFTDGVVRSVFRNNRGFWLKIDGVYRYVGGN